MALRWKTWLVLTCVSLMVFTTSLEASHIHHDALTDVPFSKPLSKSSATHCLLCSSLHSPAISSAAIVLGTTPVHCPAAPAVNSQGSARLEAFGLFVRPPPIMA